MQEFSAIAIITWLAVISPGADFAMVTRNSLTNGRLAGLLTVCGIAAGVLIHVTYTLFGVAALMRSTPELYTILRYAGAGYLLWLGYKTFTNTTPPTPGSVIKQSPFKSIRQVFFTNALNPRTTIFVLSTFISVVHAGTSLGVQMAYGLFMSLSHLVWFTLVALFFSMPWFLSRVDRYFAGINRILGALLFLLSVKLIIGR